jgi:membrane protease YdiL (CAAX protease family)
MAAAGLTVVATAFVGGLALLAHWGKKNRSAEVSLIVLLLFLSLLVAAFGALAGIGLLLTSFGEGESLISSTWLPIAAAGIAAILASMIGLALCVPPLLKVTGRRESGFWSDPTIFFALWVFVLVLANNVVNLLVFTWSPDAAQFVPTGEGRASPGLILLSELPLFIVAVLGVGIGIRRSPREVLARLGYGPVSLPQLGLAALFVAGALLLSFAADVLFAYIQPDLYEQVGKVTDRLFDPRGLSPGYMVLFALLIGAGAAAGEETLFRGALQPVLGIPLTSILFASLHTQYGLSIGLGYVLLLSVGLGLLRKWANTTLSFLAHTVYNFWLVALSYFFST